MRRWRNWFWMALLLTVLAGVVGCSGDELAVTLASGDGINLSGSPAAVAPGVTITLAGVTRGQATEMAPLPLGRIFAAGADCRPAGVAFLQPVTLTIPLANAIFTGEQLPLFRLQNQKWADTGQQATVGAGGLSASVQITRCATYLLCLDSQWETVSYDGTPFVARRGNVPPTVLTNPRVLAAGKVDDPAVLASVAQITGRTEAQVVELLRSYDSTEDHIVKVLQLQEDLYVERYWTPPGKLGRWYSPTRPEGPFRPEDARRIYALPDVTDARHVTLYRLKRGARVVWGYCADMTWNPEVFGPYATGGGEQYYAPDATKWVVDHAEVNEATMSLIAELRYALP